MLDNFTYSLLGFGIRTIHSNFVSVTVIFLIILLMANMFAWCKKYQAPESMLQGTGTAVMVTELMILLGGLTLWLSASEFEAQPPGVVEGASPSINIIIIGVDALEAGHMSVYGYQKDTTPLLEARRHEFLISENSFTNHSPSFGSIGSLLSGKYPTTTRLIFPPDVLTGEDQFKHFPGILQEVGYRSLDMSVRWYADPVDMNFRCGFDLSNFRAVSNCNDSPTAVTELLKQFDLPLILIQKISDRVMERLDILNPWVELAPNPDGLLRVGQPPRYWYKDHARIQAAVEFIELADDQPFFINLHLMTAHGPYYHLDERHFSSDQKQTIRLQDDFYDDAIRQVDSHIGSIFQALQSNGLLESTVLVISSDHGRDQSSEARLPLMIRFPDTRYSKVINSNTQRLDIAPTLLDFIGLDIPDWMEGDSLLSSAPNNLTQRAVIQTLPSTIFDNTGKGAVLVTDTSPPFFSLGSLNIIKCDQVFSWDLERNTWQVGEISGHTKPCQENSETELFDFMRLARNHLVERGYDLKSMQNPSEDTAGSVNQ